MSQVDCINGPKPRTWEDYRKGCHGTFNGGYETAVQSHAFHHGMDTVFNLLVDEFPPATLCKIAQEMLEVLKWLDQIGGLGLTVHERISKVIAKVEGTKK